MSNGISKIAWRVAPAGFLPDVTSTRSFSHQTRIGRSAESPVAQIKGWME
jgi:hypothetical protein